MWPFKRKEKPLKTAFLWQYCRGWFVGNFEPSICKANFEVAYHCYSSGETTKNHYHKYSDEINLVVEGECEVEQGGCKYKFCEGDIFLVPKNTSIKFTAIKDKTSLVVIKTKSVKGDKYYV